MAACCCLGETVRSAAAQLAPALQVWQVTDKEAVLPGSIEACLHSHAAPRLEKSGCQNRRKDLGSEKHEE